MTKQKLTLYTLALLLGIFLQLSSQTSVPFPQAVITKMATRKMRYHHYLWHQVRDRWNSFSSSTQKAFRNIGWEPPRPSRTRDGDVILDNNSGEDFLYMHKDMIATVNSIIASTKDPYGPIKGWTTLPAPGDKEFPVPKTYTIPGDSSATSSSNNRKTDSFYKSFILPNEKIFTDPVQLRRMTLGELGARLETTVHNYLHMRFSEQCSYGYRSGSSGTIPNVDTKWDDVRYNWLGDSYSAHVHPWFWKIHGWVDDRIEDWRKANSLKTIPWKGTWMGGPMTSLSGVGVKSMSASGMVGGGNLRTSDDAIGDVMQEALDLLLASTGSEASFADEVKIKPWTMVTEGPTVSIPTVPPITVVTPPTRPRVGV